MKWGACESQVRRMIGNHMGMNLDIWSSRSVVRSDDRSLAGDAGFVQLLEKVLALPGFKAAKLFGEVEGNFDDEGGTYSSCTANVKATVELQGREFEVDKNEGLFEIEELAEQLEAQGDAGAVQVREALQALADMQQGIEDGHFSEVDFWKEYDPFTITREMYDQYRLKTGEVNWIGFSKKLLHDNYVDPGLEVPPVRWTEFELAPQRLRARLKMGMHPECTDEAGQSPLNAAAYRGMEEAAQLLLQAGADPNAVDATAVSPVVTAVYRGHATVLDRLVAAGGRIDGPSHAPSVLFAIHADAQANHPMLLGDLLARGLDLYARMPDGGTLAQDVERYTDNAEFIRAVRAAVLSDEISGAMPGGDEAESAGKSCALAL